jgi:hypothetical protein
MPRATKFWWWSIYLALQLVGLFHLFVLLPYHYRHSLGRLFIQPLLPGGPLAMWLDSYVLRRTRLTLSDDFLVAIVTLSINCGLFALAIGVVSWAGRVRKNSWSANSYTRK